MGHRGKGKEGEKIRVDKKVTVISVYGDSLDYKFYRDILAVGYACYSRIPMLF